MKRVYISGKIGEAVISEATRRKFARAEETLRAMNYEVVSPVAGRWQQQLKSGYGKRCAENWDYPLTFYAYALLHDLQQLATCDAVCFLDDWDQSPGAQVEFFYAVAVGKRLLFEAEVDARLNWDMTPGWRRWEDAWLPLDGSGSAAAQPTGGAGPGGEPPGTGAPGTGRRTGRAAVLGATTEKA